MAKDDHPPFTINVTEDDHDAYVSIAHGFHHGWIGNTAYPPIKGKEFYDQAHQAAHAKAQEARREVDTSGPGEVASVLFTWVDGPRFDLTKA